MNNISIIVDKRTELLGILLLISDYNKNYGFLIEECGNKEYRQKIFTNFSQYKNEKAVKLLNQIFEELNFRYDAPVSLFLQLNDDFTYDKLDDYPFKTRLKESQLVLDFLKELPDFAKTINFDDYFKSNTNFYKEIIEETNDKVNVKKVVEFISNFYKIDISNIKFVINLLPYITNGNFGSHHNDITYSNLGLKKNQIKELTFITDIDFGTLILHEFSHSIINPLTSKYSNIPGKAFADIWEQMKLRAYGHVESIINEHIIRAIELFYLKNIIKTPEAMIAYDKKLEFQLSIGFKYVPVCLELLENYYIHKDNFGNFEEYFPYLINEFEKATKKTDK